MNQAGFTAKPDEMPDEHWAAGPGPWANSWHPAWLETAAPREPSETSSGGPSSDSPKEVVEYPAEVAERAMKQALMDCYNG